MVCNLYNSIIEYKNNYVIPTYMINFAITALWYWTYIKFHVLKLFYKCFGVFLTYTPNILLYNPLESCIFPNKPIVIIEAKCNEGNITNKIKIISMFKWDRDIENEETGFIGGLNRNDIFSMLDTEAIWCKYTTDIDDHVVIKYLFTTRYDDIIYRTPDFKTPEKILYEQIPF
jgi:hypothetical protein